VEEYIWHKDKVTGPDEQGITFRFLAEAALRLALGPHNLSLNNTPNYPWTKAAKERSKLLKSV